MVKRVYYQKLNEKIEDGNIIDWRNFNILKTAREPGNSLGVEDLICFEKSGVNVNGFLVMTNPSVLTAYNELKNNPSKVNDYYKLDRAS